MRADPASYELAVPGNLPGVLSLLARQPGEWIPIAGGTDLMVLYSAGKLSARKLVSLWNLPELRRFEVSGHELAIGAGCTYTDLREHDIVQREFPLLASAASWTGGIANQNRGTLGGNIVNASPAADSLPALLVYEAELILASARGERRVPYVEFHTGYKKTLLAGDELIRAICLPRRYTGYISFSRKVGARNAQAISKVCVAVLARMSDEGVKEIRIAAGSVAPVPMRFRKTEQFITAKTVDAAAVSQAREMVRQEIHPIDDMRSTAAYRSAVVGNLVAEFLNSLTQAGRTDVLLRWNQLDADAAATEVMPCCGSQAWAHRLAERRPFKNTASLMAASDEIWGQLAPQDWLEAFSKHPRIGERKAPDKPSAQSAAWSAQEQRDAAAADEAAKSALAEGNREYEKRFGRVFIVCASGKSASEILDILQQRLNNDDATELHIAAEEQRKITDLRLKKWLG
jgi:OHCU decarboxylase